MNPSELLGAMKRNLEQLAAFNQIAKALTSTLEVGEVLQVVMQEVSKLLQPESWSLLEASLAGHTSPRAWSMHFVPLWLMARFAAEGPLSQRSVGLAYAERALVSTRGRDAKFERARSNVMRSFVLFRL